MRIAKIKFNDIANGQGIGVSVFEQGCPRNPHCKGCFNPETWDFNGGYEFTEETLNSIIEGLIKNDVARHLSLLGGEPLCLENLPLTRTIITRVKEELPETKIYVWTGYTIEELRQCNNYILEDILSTIDFLIDGPYIEKERDITLLMRGSKNQRIWDLKNGKEITNV